MPRAFNLNVIQGDNAVGLTAAGTTQGTATIASADHVTVTTVTSTNRGVILKAGDDRSIRTVVNADSADTLYVYPWSGAAFNGAAANLHLALPPQTSALFIQHSPTVIAAIF